MTSEVVEHAAAQLRDTISSTLGDLADMVTGRPAFGTPEWFAERDKPAAYRAATLRDWHLVKISISVAAGVEPTGDLINARLYGASWQQLGTALGTSRQAAHERWSPVCERSTARLDSEAEVLAAADRNREMADAESDSSVQ